MKKFLDTELERHGQGLLRMLQCETVSVRDIYDDTEFEKLRNVTEQLFPNVMAAAEKHVFSDDCWMYKLPGKDPSRNIMLMSHHDVVPAEGEWHHTKFGEIAEGKVWGRGAVDTKGPLYAELAALEELLEAGEMLPVNVWLGSSHNEELGGDGVPKARDWFVEQGITFEVILDEGGAVIDPPIGGMKCSKCAMVAVHEFGKQYLDLEATAENGHASLTSATIATPVSRMTALIQELVKGDLFIHRLNPQVLAMFRGLGPHCRFPLNIVLTHANLFSPILKHILPKISPQAGAMIGTTCIPKDINGTAKEKRCTAMVLLRPVDAADWEKDLNAVKKLAEKYGISVSIRANSEYQEPADMLQPQFAYTMNQIGQAFPEYPAAPTILPAGTDARTLTDVCPCVLRFTPFRLSASQLASVHAEDENIDMEAIGEAVEFYKNYIREYV